MSTLNRMLRTIYSKLDEDGAIDHRKVYKACDDQGELIAACMDSLTPPQIAIFFDGITALMFPDSKAEMMLGSWHIADHFDPDNNRYAVILIIAMAKYSYADYLADLEYEKSCEDDETDNERNEYERSTLKTI